MERRRFALSWGRKIFFGLGWPLLSLLGLVFLKSGVIPLDATSAFYYIVTNIGYYGLLTAILYFIFFVPFALIFPTYYFVRLWSAFLIIVSSYAILIDGMVFGEYRFHINRLILAIFSTKGPAEIFNGSIAPYVVCGGISVFLFFVLWIRGEWLWRVMQRRFSNPVKNWYLVAIILCLGLSHLIWNKHRTNFYGNEITLASLFPLNYQEIFYPKVNSSEAMSRVSLNYPKKDLKCKARVKPNVIFVVMENLGTQMISEESTPFLSHLQKHGINFQSHLSGGGTPDDNIFRLMYGIPASYRPEASSSAMMNELEKNGYTVSVFSSRRIPGLPFQQNIWEQWAENYKQRDPATPNFIFFDLNAGMPDQIDMNLRETFGKLHDLDLLAGSTIVITGTQSSEWETVPMTLVVPEREKGEWQHRTTHYDITPTILKKILNCKTSPHAYSYGKDLAEPPSKDWEIFGNENTFRIADFTNRLIIESDWHGKIMSGNDGRTELVLKASREISRFYRR